MKKARYQKAFTIVELLLSLVILAILMTAVAVAFDASIVNFQANESISKTTNTARAALLRMTGELRTAQAVAIIGAGGDPDNSQCSFIAADGSNLCYRYSPNDQTLYLDTNGNSYAMCKHVTAATFSRSPIAGSNPVAIRNVRMILTLTDTKGNNPQTLAAAAVVRRNLE